MFCSVIYIYIYMCGNTVSMLTVQNWSAIVSDNMALTPYTKLFHRILTSSIWQEDDKTRLIWITLLAMVDSEGQIFATAGAIADRARVPKESVLLALEKFKAPDPESTTRVMEGRRIVVIEGGWKLINHEKYKEMMSSEQRREYYRTKKAEYRKKAKDIQKGMTTRQVIRERAAAEDCIDKG